MANPLHLLDDAAAAVAWLRARVPGTLRTDSRAVQRGDGFIAWPGAATDGRRYVAAALAAGAAAVLVEADGADAFDLPEDPRIAALAGLKAATGPIADGWFGQPSSRLRVVASTGTNGKTSTAWWMAQALSALGRRSGVIGTLGVGEPPHVQPTGLTTPDPVTLQRTLAELAGEGFAACAMEASSIGIVEHRLAATRIEVALFTNFTQDHLDYHGTMDAYWAAKRRLFDWPGLRAAVVNTDDATGAALARELAGGSLDLWTVSCRGPARLAAVGLHHAPEGLAFEAVEAGQRVPVATRLVGDFNASNALVVLGGLRAMGLPLADAARAVGQLTPVPGRLQRFSGAGLEVVVDYAHTPDALEQVLRALRPLAAARGGRLWCVFGCGGNRDAIKRPLMGAIAARHADRVVVTSDNPRDEVPSTILAHILAGVTGHDEVDVIEDRREAVHHAVRHAAAGDVVLLAGKGHEDYQEVAGVKRAYSDLLETEAALRARAGGTAA